MDPVVVLEIASQAARLTTTLLRLQEDISNVAYGSGTLETEVEGLQEDLKSLKTTVDSVTSFITRRTFQKDSSLAEAAQVWGLLGRTLDVASAALEQLDWNPNSPGSSILSEDDDEVIPFGLGLRQPWVVTDKRALQHEVAQVRGRVKLVKSDLQASSHLVIYNFAVVSGDNVQPHLDSLMSLLVEICKQVTLLGFKPTYDNLATTSIFEHSRTVVKESCDVITRSKRFSSGERPSTPSSGRSDKSWHSSSLSMIQNWMNALDVDVPHRPKTTASAVSSVTGIAATGTLKWTESTTVRHKTGNRTKRVSSSSVIPIPTSKTSQVAIQLQNQGLLPPGTLTELILDSSYFHSNPAGKSALRDGFLMACEQGPYESALTFIRLGSTVNTGFDSTPGQLRLSPLAMAAASNRSRIVELLIEVGADPDVSVELSLMDLDPEKAKRAWQTCPYLPQRFDCTALALALLYEQDNAAESILKFYQESDVDVNQSLWLPLVLAVWSERCKLVGTLLDARAATSTDIMGVHILSITNLAAIKGNIDMLKTLSKHERTRRMFEKPACMELTNQQFVGSTLHAAVYASVKITTVFASDQSKMFIPSAVAFKHVVYHIVKHKLADIDAVDANGQTAVQWAVRCAQLDNRSGRDFSLPCAIILISVLLESGADPNIQDQDGSTALHLLLERSLEKGAWETSYFQTMMNMLLKRQARCNIRDNQGLTPAAILIDKLDQMQAFGRLFGTAGLNMKRASKVLRKREKEWNAFDSDEASR